MADEVIVDALPYIDHGYDDVGVRESVISVLFYTLLSYNHELLLLGAGYGWGGMPTL